MGKNLLENLNLDIQQEDKEIIYGVYDNREKNLFVRLNDFFIDHGKVSIKDRSYFFYLLAVMVDAGIPIIQALKILVSRTQNLHFRRVINTMEYGMEHKGEPLHKAMQKFPAVFGDSEIGLVKSGETTGKLDEMLFRLAKQLEQSYELNLKLKSALIYPATIISALIIAAFIVVIFVIPKLKSFFVENHVSLPMPTQILLSISNFMGNYWWLIIFTTIGAILIGNFYVNTEQGKFKWHYYLLKTPLIGEMLVKISIIRFVRLLGVLVESGIPITQSLKTCADSIGNEVYRKKLLLTADNIAKGEKISDNLDGASLIFPKTLVEMIRIGENSASLDRSAEKMANHFEREIEHDLKNTMAILEPALIILIGLVVVAMAFAIMSPIFNLSNLV